MTEERRLIERLSRMEAVYTTDMGFLICFFCENETHEGHKEDCLWKEAYELTERDNWIDPDETVIVQPCPNCEGNGSVQSDDGSELVDCLKCEGEGRIEIN